MTNANDLAKALSNLFTPTAAAPSQHTKAPSPQAQPTSFEWASVTAPVSGIIQVQLDGDSAPLSYTPDALVGLAAGTRVWCLNYGSYVVVLGGAAASGWKTYTPTLTAPSTPVLGVGSTITGTYIQQPDKTVIANVEIVCGTSGWTTGSGSYLVSLPVPLAAGSLCGSMVVKDSSAADVGICLAATALPATTVNMITNNGAVSSTANHPQANRKYLLNMIYQGV